MKSIITDLDHLGRGIIRKNKITFIPKTIPGDEVEYQIKKENKNYNEGRLTKTIKKSNNHIDALCPYYNICGGCNISNLSYPDQLEYKKNKVANIFKKYSNIDIVKEILPSEKEYHYRNKITYHKDTNLGLVSIDNDIININECLLVSNKINNLFNKIKKDNIVDVKEITIREVDNGLILKIKGHMNIESYKNDVIEIYENDKLIYQKEKPYIILNNIKYIITGNSFFQINTTNIEKLYNTIIEKGNFSKEDNVVDLYCGVGSITLYVSKYVKSILGIEIVPDAIENAKENAKINNITNAKFLCGDVSKLINGFIIADTIIVDPPRSGLDKHTIDVLNKLNLKKIVYVSCDPMTLSRDINLLTKYKFRNITMVDMFPQTYHVENVCLLSRKD